MTIQLPAGSLLVLYTDGLIEQRGTELGIGLARLVRVAAGPPGHPDSVCDRLLAAAFNGEKPNDDVALLAVRLAPAPVEPLAINLPATAEALAELRAVLRSWLVAATAGSAEDTADDLVVAAGEAAANVVKHAYPPPPPERTGFAVAAQLVDGVVTVSVRDHGTWQPPDTVDRGRGLLMMEGLVDELQIVHHDDGTEVRLVKNLTGQSR